MSWLQGPMVTLMQRCCDTMLGQEQWWVQCIALQQWHWNSCSSQQAMASGIINIDQSVEGCSGRKQHKHNDTDWPCCGGCLSGQWQSCSSCYCPVSNSSRHNINWLVVWATGNSTSSMAMQVDTCHAQWSVAVALQQLLLLIELLHQK